MKLKYYLRGLGIGIIVTTIILTIAGSSGKQELSDAEIIEKAQALGMVMEEDGNTLSDQIEQNTQTTEQTDTNVPEEQTTPEEPDSTEEGVIAPEGGEQTATDTSTVPEATSYHLAIDAGEVCRQVCDELYANGVIDDSEAFRKYLSDSGYAKQIQPGNYEITYGMSYEEIAQLLITRQ